VGTKSVCFLEVEYYSGGGGGGIGEDPDGTHQMPDAAAAAAAAAWQQEFAPPPEPGPVRFLFFVGIEGVGHHVVKSLARKSPLWQYLQRTGLLGDLTALTRSMYPLGDGGLFYSHCKVNADPEAVGKQRRRVIELFRTVSANLTTALSLDGEDEERGGRPVFTIPLNAVDYFFDEMASYPQDGGPCRSLKYPALELLYDVCAEAGVRCQHAYLYRDPYAVLRSTTFKRHFNKNGALQAIKLYTTMLHVIYSQFSRYGPSRAVGCYDLFAGDDDSTRSEIWYPLRDILGWRHPELLQLPPPPQGQKHRRGVIPVASFDSVLRTVIPEDVPINETEKLAMVPYGPEFMAPMARMHDAVVDLCRRQVAAAGASSGAV